VALPVVEERKMMQMDQIQRRLSEVLRVVDFAAQECQSESNVPGDLRACLRELDLSAARAGQVMQSHDEMRIRAWVEDMEALTDRAERVVTRSSSVESELRHAILEAHNELLNLKHQLQ
jgi:hypothetical protein